MNPITNMNPNKLHEEPYQPTPAERAQKPSEVQKTEAVSRTGDVSLSQPAAPVMDEYIPEEKKEPIGRYWLENDENGKPKIHFDDPKRAEDAEDIKNGSSPAKDKNADSLEDSKNTGTPEENKNAGNDKKAETCTGNTDKVDREIEKLKKKQAELQKQLNSETDERKIKQLESQLAQVENELRQKDNDTYRRQHTQFSYS